MPKVYEGQLVAKGKTFGIVAARFNEFITNKLLEGALEQVYACLCRVQLYCQAQMRVFAPLFAPIVVTRVTKKCLRVSTAIL